MYIEKCENYTMIAHTFFEDKLTQIQNILTPDAKRYHLGNIIWNDNILHHMTDLHQYPSEYFIKVISNMCIIENHIVNPPLQIPDTLIDKLIYVPLHYNKLLIIDALMKQGSNRRYDNNNIGVYSEHSGVLSIKNGIIDSVIVFADTDRLDMSDETIFLPRDTPMSYHHEYMFHTHPNTDGYAGRLSDGILYEFPSNNDIFYFAQCHNRGRIQGSIIVTPEGTYVIRPIRYEKKIVLNKILYDTLRQYILVLEQKAITLCSNILDKLSDPDIFHKHISLDFIKAYNKFIKKYNIYVEFYPREKKNGEWCLKPISLILIDK